MKNIIEVIIVNLVAFLQFLFPGHDKKTRIKNGLLLAILQTLTTKHVMNTKLFPIHYAGMAIKSAVDNIADFNRPPHFLVMLSRLVITFLTFPMFKRLFKFFYAPVIIMDVCLYIAISLASPEQLKKLGI